MVTACCGKRPATQICTGSSNRHRGEGRTVTCTAIPAPLRGRGAALSSGCVNLRQTGPSAACPFPGLKPLPKVQQEPPWPLPAAGQHGLPGGVVQSTPAPGAPARRRHRNAAVCAWRADSLVIREREITLKAPKWQKEIVKPLPSPRAVGEPGVDGRPGLCALAKWTPTSQKPAVTQQLRLAVK